MQNLASVCSCPRQDEIDKGVGRGQVKRWRNNPLFEEKVQAARDEATERLEAEADRRGYTGYPEAVFYEGVHVADRTRYTDQLLMFRLKALAPEKYRDRKQVEVKEAPVTVVLPDNGRSS